MTVMANSQPDPSHARVLNTEPVISHKMIDGFSSYKEVETMLPPPLFPMPS